MRGRFEDIEAWKTARSLTNEVYKLTDLRGRNLSNEVRERDNNYSPRLTDHEKLPHLPGCSIHPAFLKALHEKQSRMAQRV